MESFKLSGKRILVTGASSGIGRACAICAAELGASVILSGRREASLKETLAKCPGEGHLVVVGDITLHENIDNVVEKTGKIDGLVHAAGIGPMCPIGMIDETHVDDIFKTNYFSFLNLMKAYSRAKNRRESFSAVAISSISGIVGWGGISAYAGSKGALNASVRALAVELASKGIRVNAVCPSNIKTPLYYAGAVNMNDSASLQELIKKQPLGLGEPWQVAMPVCFLLSDAASFITGVTLPVDGGYLAQ